MDLKETLQQIVFDAGADAFGVAELETAAAAIHKAYGDTFDGYTRAVSFAVHLPRRVVDEVLDHPSHTYLAYYDIANSLLNRIGLIVNNRLEREGFLSFPIPASQRTRENKEGGIFSHRMAAQMAGLGWIGKNCSLISPQNGPRLRLGTVLTDAPLEPDSPIENRCGDCTQCRDICPAGAILGKAFDCNDALSQRFDFKKCDAYLSETRQTFGKRICGRCIAVCPYGRKKHAKEGQ